MVTALPRPYPGSLPRTPQPPCPWPTRPDIIGGFARNQPKESAVKEAIHPRVPRRRGPLRVRGNVEDPLDQARAAPGNLLELPSVFHRPAEADRYRRPHRSGSPASIRRADRGGTQGAGDQAGRRSARRNGRPPRASSAVPSRAAGPRAQSPTRVDRKRSPDRFLFATVIFWRSRARRCVTAVR